jgi:hypothetical protein
VSDGIASSVVGGSHKSLSRFVRSALRFHKKHYANNNFNVLSISCMVPLGRVTYSRTHAALPSKRRTRVNTVYRPCEPQAARAKLCCGASNSARRSLIPSEGSSSRIRKRARSDSDGTLGPSSVSIATLSGSVRLTIVTSDRGKGPTPWEISAGPKRAPCGRFRSPVAI